jgi:hypothetical protein
MLIIETTRKIVLVILPMVKGEYSNFEQTCNVLELLRIGTLHRWEFSRKCKSS